MFKFGLVMLPASETTRVSESLVSQARLFFSFEQSKFDYLLIFEPIISGNVPNVE